MNDWRSLNCNNIFAFSNFFLYFLRALSIFSQSFESIMSIKPLLRVGKDSGKRESLYPKEKKIEFYTMFTGIIESQGIVKDIITSGTNKTFWIESSISSELKVEQSVSHNGVCLTVEALAPNCHRVTAIRETLVKSNFNHCKVGDIVNLERGMVLNSRIDGHIVLGHVDTIGTCIARDERDGSWEYRIRFPEKMSHLIIEKGSICLNGISLTVFNVMATEFSVAIIPFTFEHTNINKIEPGNLVNLEFDFFGKYISRIAEARKAFI